MQRSRYCRRYLDKKILFIRLNGLLSACKKSTKQFYSTKLTELFLKNTHTKTLLYGFMNSSEAVCSLFLHNEYILLFIVYWYWVKVISKLNAQCSLYEDYIDECWFTSFLVMIDWYIFLNWLQIYRALIEQNTNISLRTVLYIHHQIK